MRKPVEFAGFASPSHALRRANPGIDASQENRSRPARLVLRGSKACSSKGAFDAGLQGNRLVATSRLGNQKVRSLPTLAKRGFALRSSAGWSWRSEATRIQSSLGWLLAPLLSLASVRAVVARSKGLCLQSPNTSFNGTCLRPAR